MEEIIIQGQEASAPSYFSKRKVDVTTSSKILNQEVIDEVELGISPASFFVEIASEEDSGIQNFKKFIANRKSYLENLKNLGEGWISGKSYPPNNEVLQIGKGILNFLETWYETKVMLFQVCYVPTIIMSPIPTGGLAFEIIPQQGIKIYLNIFNNENIEIELDNQGSFSDIDTSMENYEEKLAEILSQYAIQSNYSRW